MEQQALILFLQSTSLVPLAMAETISSRFTAKEIPKGEFFLKEGRISNEYMFLENGFMRSFAHDPEGNDITTNFYAGRQLVFEVNSFFNRIISKENIQAVTDCTGWVLTYDELNDLFHSMPVFREFGRHILVKGFTAFKERALSMITETAEERYINLLHKTPEIFQFAQLKHVASFLGITDTSLSRIRKEFTKK